MNYSSFSHKEKAKQLVEGLVQNNNFARSRQIDPNGNLHGYKVTETDREIKHMLRTGTIEIKELTMDSYVPNNTMVKTRSIKREKDPVTPVTLIPFDKAALEAMKEAQYLMSHPLKSAQFGQYSKKYFAAANELMNSGKQELSVEDINLVALRLVNHNTRLHHTVTRYKTLPVSAYKCGPDQYFGKRNPLKLFWNEQKAFTPQSTDKEFFASNIDIMMVKAMSSKNILAEIDKIYNISMPG